MQSVCQPRATCEAAVGGQNRPPGLQKFHGCVKRACAFPGWFGCVGGGAAAIGSALRRWHEDCSCICNEIADARAPQDSGSRSAAGVAAYPTRPLTPADPRSDSDGTHAAGLAPSRAGGWCARSDTSSLVISSDLAGAARRAPRRSRRPPHRRRSPRARTPRDRLRKPHGRTCTCARLPMAGCSSGDRTSRIAAQWSGMV